MPFAAVVEDLGFAAALDLGLEDDLGASAATPVSLLEEGAGLAFLEAGLPAAEEEVLSSSAGAARCGGFPEKTHVKIGG